MEFALKEVLDNLENYGALTVKLIIALGVIVVFSYCAFQINFFPTGLTIGDSLVFIFIALGFGVFYLFWLLLAYTAVYSLAYFKINKSAFCSSESLLMFFLGIFIIALLGIYIYWVGDFMSILAPLMSGSLLIITTSFWNTEKGTLSDEEYSTKKKRRIQIGIFAVLIVPLIAVSAISEFVNGSIRILGIQQKHKSIVLDKNNFKVIQDVAKELNLPIYGCVTNGKQSNIVHNFNILWHGLGERSLVEVLIPKEGAWQPAVRVELDRTGTKVLQILDKDLSFKTCLSLSSDAVFDLYQSEPNEEGIKALGKFLSKVETYLEDSKLTILSVTITGFTDRIPVIKKNDTNEALSLRRANSVLSALSPLFKNVDKKNISILGKGPKEPLSNCPKALSGNELTKCLSVDRRVEISLRVQRKAK
jgi:OOP family OmpA-OmpF porin